MSELMDTVSKKNSTRNDYHIEVPVESVLGALRYLRDLGISSNSSYGKYGYFEENERFTEGKVSSHRDDVDMSFYMSGDTLRYETDTRWETPGKYDVHFNASRNSDGTYSGIPFVSVDRDGYRHHFYVYGKYAKRAAEIILRRTTERTAEIGHKKLEYIMAQAQMAQAALARYEQSVDQ